MCMMCDGYSEEEIHDHYDELIARFGWMVHHIGGGSLNRPPWSYTMGLSLAFDHPEFVVVGLPPPRAQGLLNTLAEGVAGGELFAAGHTLSNLDGSPHGELVEVHPLLWEGPLFVVWQSYYESRLLAPDQRALQVALEPDVAGPRARRWRRCLEDPECKVGHRELGPNRHPLPQHRRKRKGRR
jgi:Domain of unknown function (DUF4262)